MIVRPARIEDAFAVAAICDHAILARVATLPGHPHGSADRRGLFEHDPDRVPVLVAEDPLGEIVGWTALSEHSRREADRGVAECSIFVEEGRRGQGIGTKLLDAMIREARTLGYRKLISRLLLTDEASRTLCQNAGFREVGVLERQVRQDGRWIDVLLVERQIPENAL